MEEVFEFSDNKNSFTIKISDIKINNIAAFVAEFQKQGDSNYNPFKDHNEMIYYFTDKESLKNKIIQVLSNGNTQSDTF